MIGKDTETSLPFNGDDATSEFAITFPVYEEEFVYAYVVLDEGLDTETVTELTLNTDYTVAKEGIFGLQSSLSLIDSSQAWISGGGLKTGYKLYIEATREAYQPANLRSIGAFSPAQIEMSLDRMAMSLRRSNDYLDDELSDLDARFEAMVTLIETTTGLAVDTVVAANGAQLAMDETSARQHLIKVSGNGGPVTLSNTPFLGAVDDGRIIMVMGLSDTNTVRINHADVAGGCIMQGDIILRRFDIIYFIRDAANGRFIEVSRSKR